VANRAKRKQYSKPKKQEIPLFVLTNEITEFKGNVLRLFYQAAEMRQLAYMDGMDPDTGEIVPLLVGLEPTADGQFNVAPLAKLISKSQEIIHYLVPDGNGSYFNNEPTVGRDGFDSPEEEGQAEEGREPEA